MRKPLIVKLWAIGLVVLLAGLAVGFISLAVMLAYGGHFVPSGVPNNYNFIPAYDGTFWTSVTVMTLAFLAAAVGMVVGLAAWIGALVNTYHIEDKTWFAILLGSGVLGLAYGLPGFAGMLAYVIAGPDGLAAQPVQPMQPAQSAQLPASVPSGSDPLPTPAEPSRSLAHAR